MERGHLSDMELAQLAQIVVNGKDSEEIPSTMAHALQCPSCFYELQQSISEYWHLAGVDDYLAAALTQEDFSKEAQKDSDDKKTIPEFRLLLRDLGRGFRVLDKWRYYLTTPMPTYRSTPSEPQEFKSVQFVAFWQRVPVRVAVSKDIRGQWQFDFGALPASVKEIRIHREVGQESKLLVHNFGIEMEHNIGLSSAQIFGQSPVEELGLAFYFNEDFVGALELTRSNTDEMV